MHELPVTRGILEVALDAARGAGGRDVTAIDIVVGDLSSIVDDSVQLYFDLLSRDTPAAGARLRFQRLPARARCLTCGHGFPVSPPMVRACLRCGGGSLRVTGGRELYVSSIEVTE